jgi:uncharacterized protein (TIGR03118 family)
MDGIQIAGGSRFTGQLMAWATAIALCAVPVAHAAPPDRYQQHNLVTDGFAAADHTDGKLVNPWGVVFNPFGPVWISDNGSGYSTVYDGAGAGFPATPIVVKIPDAAGGNPTGIVYNGSSGFNIAGPSTPAAFIFATESGYIVAWNKTVDPANAIIVAQTPGAIYKGLALSAGGSGSLLYATDFHNNRIDVWNSSFMPVSLGAGAFTDPKIPPGFAPFGIQAINGNVYVTYAKQDADAEDDVAGKGLGYVDVYDPNGNLIDRVAAKGKLNAPWGLALAPAAFGEFSNSLLVGNFGDGRINAFDVATGQYLGQIKGMDGKPLTIDGLWGIAFGNGFLGQPVNTLFFTAGPADEEHGLYGRIDPLPDHGHDHD